MKSLLKRQLYREFIYYCRAPRQIVYGCIFFLMMLAFFPLTISANTNTLRLLAPGLIWIDVLFALFLSAEQLFQHDYDDGVIEQWLISGESMYLWVCAKVFVHWGLNVLSLLCLCPIIGLLLHLTAVETAVLMVSLVCGTPAILFLCALASVFSTGLKQKGILMALIVFPLTIPIMIFGSGALTTAMVGLPVQGYLAILLALSTLAVGFLPFAISAVVSMSLSD